MSIKDKVIISLIILFVVILGVVLNREVLADFYPVDTDDSTTLNYLAKIASQDQNRFLTMNINTELKNKKWTKIDGKMVNDTQGIRYVIGYNSGVCLYHYNADNTDREYKISNVIDFGFNEGNFWIKNNRNICYI